MCTHLCITSFLDCLSVLAFDLLLRLGMGISLGLGQIVTKTAQSKLHGTQVKVQVSSHLKFTDGAVIVFVVFRRLGLSTMKWEGCNEVVEAFELWNLLQFPVINLEIEWTSQ